MRAEAGRRQSNSEGACGFSARQRPSTAINMMARDRSRPVRSRRSSSGRPVCRTGAPVTSVFVLPRRAGRARCPAGGCTGGSTGAAGGIAAERRTLRTGCSGKGMGGSAVIGSGIDGPACAGDAVAAVVRGRPSGSDAAGRSRSQRTSRSSNGNAMRSRKKRICSIDMSVHITAPGLIEWAAAIEGPDRRSLPASSSPPGCSACGSNP